MCIRDRYNAHTVIIKKETVDLHCLIAQVIDEIYPTLSANGNTAVFTAVSYTHLDVYKRQGYDDVKVGDTVTLDYRAGMRSEYKPEEFVVSGILYDLSLIHI